MREWFLEENLELYLSYYKRTKKSYKTYQRLMGIVTFLLYSLLTLMIGNMLLFIGLPFMCLFAYKYPYLAFMMKKKQDDLLKGYLFPEFLRYFMCLVENSGNVYNALKETSINVRGSLKPELEKLIENIGKRNDREYYLEFAKFIGNTEAFMSMNIIYELSAKGMDREALEEIRRFIEKLHQNKTDELIQHKLNGMFKYSMPSILLSVMFVFGFAGVLFAYYMGQIGDAMSVFN